MQIFAIRLYDLLRLDHRYALWALLAIPAYPLVVEWIYDDQHYPELMHTTGTFSSQLLVLTLCITPLSRLAKYLPVLSSPLRWMRQRRRYFGVASFLYALAHTILYLIDMQDIVEVWHEAFDFELGVGWLAFVGLALLAASSNDFAVTRLGKNWKTLQRLAYPMAVCVFIHWLLFDYLLNDFVFYEVFYWFMPLALLQIYRLIAPRTKRPK